MQQKQKMCDVQQVGCLGRDWLADQPRPRGEGGWNIVGGRVQSGGGTDEITYSVHTTWLVYGDTPLIILCDAGLDHTRAAEMMLTHSTAV